MSPERETVLITGASSGIGAATAALLAASGYRVFGTSRGPVPEAASGDMEMLALDVRSGASVGACVETLLERAGRIDALVNNAGFALHGESEGTTPEQAVRQLETNVVGVMRVTNAVLPAMRREGRGRIVNVSSLAGLTAVPFLSVYCASKYALEGYSEVLRYELRDFGIWVTLIEPGFVKTPLIVAGEAAAAPWPPMTASARRPSTACRPAPRPACRPSRWRRRSCGRSTLASPGSAIGSAVRARGSPGSRLSRPRGGTRRRRVGYSDWTARSELGPRAGREVSGKDDVDRTRADLPWPASLDALVAAPASHELRFGTPGSACSRSRSSRVHASPSTPTIGRAS
jgi:NAD(P)-dependent dehydrogenase (short-subunit alcohol dehydrogenase family)